MFIKSLNLIQIPKPSLPPKYKKLLDHDKSMTLRLENFYQQEMAIKVIENRLLNNTYKREIVMLGAKDLIPRELAYIEIFLENLPDKSVREEIIKGEKPFGKILLDNNIKTRREIDFFFKVPNNDKRISKYSNFPNDFYYGRKYSIFSFSQNPKKKRIANIIENIF